MKTILLKVTLTCLVTLGATTGGLLGTSKALANVNALEAKAQSDKLVTQARRLIVDALPEERERAHESLIQAILAGATAPDYTVLRPITTGGLEYFERVQFD